MFAASAAAEAVWTRHCTYSDPSRFFSYRRSVHAREADYGRLIAAIRAAGYDVCCHGWRWVKHFELSEAEERDHIARAVTIARTLPEASDV